MNNISISRSLKDGIRSKFIRYPLMLIVIALGLFVIFREAHHLKGKDFIVYWSVARENMGFKPPEELLTDLEQGGWSPQFPTTMYTPPWALPLIMFFGFFDLSIGQLLWLFVHIGVLLLCANLIWKLYGGCSEQRWIAWVVTIIFSPTFAVLEKGQITPFVLLGITGFLYFTVNRRNDWAAGAFLALAAIKPQLLYLFWIALLFWVIQQRRWLILVSGAVFVLLLTLVTMAFNPHVIQQYLDMIRNSHISDWATPTIGSYLRFFWFGTDTIWPQFIPTIIGGLWFLYYWSKHHGSWRWLAELPILLLVSLVTTPFAWTYDLIILLPAIIQASIWLLQDWKRWSTFLLAGLFLGINILDLILHVRLSDFWFVWMAPGLLSWYLLVNWQKSTWKLKVPV
jgi:hypothetical protein